VKIGKLDNAEPFKGFGQALQPDPLMGGFEMRRP
jgi:hypothetical protein